MPAGPQGGVIDPTTGLPFANVPGGFVVDDGNGGWRWVRDQPAPQQQQQQSQQLPQQPPVPSWGMTTQQNHVSWAGAGAWVPQNLCGGYPPVQGQQPPNAPYPPGPPGFAPGGGGWGGGGGGGGYGGNQGQQECHFRGTLQAQTTFGTGWDGCGKARDQRFSALL